MFIVYLIIFLMQFQLSVNSYTVLKNENTSEGSLLVSNVSNILGNTYTAAPRTLFHVLISTENKKPDLKANIFDKMLSDEMLSIKQQIHEKDTTDPSTVFIKTRGSIPTPTLELKQMWPIEKLETSNEKKYNFEQHMKNIDNTPIHQYTETRISFENNNETNNNNSNKEKVLELRSLSDKLHKKIKTSSLLHHITKHCTCTNFNSQTTKSHRLTDNTRDQGDKKLHFRDDLHDSDPNAHSKCSRTYPISTTTAFPFYITYSPYFVGTVADFSNIYYHPDVISDLKRPKHHKYRKHKKPTTEHLYEDDSEESIEEYDEKTTRRKEESKTNYDFKIVFEPTYEPESDKQLEDQNLHILDKNKFVENIVDDLKVYYNEAVIKDCYCSACSLKRLQIMSIVYLLQWLA